MWLLFYELFDVALHFEVLQTADSKCLTHDDAHTFVSRVSRQTRAFTLSWNTNVVVHSCEQHGNFSHQGPPSLDFSPSPSSVVSSLTSRSLSSKCPLFLLSLCPRSPSSRKLSNMQLVRPCVASRIIWKNVSRHLDKLREAFWTIFSENKAQKCKQQATDRQRRWHFGDLQQQPRRWPSRGKSFGAKLSLCIYVLGRLDGCFCDVYLRPLAVNGLKG